MTMSVKRPVLCALAWMAVMTAPADASLIPRPTFGAPATTGAPTRPLYLAESDDARGVKTLEMTDDGIYEGGELIPGSGSDPAAEPAASSQPADAADADEATEEDASASEPELGGDEAASDDADSAHA